MTENQTDDKSLKKAIRESHSASNRNSETPDNLPKANKPKVNYNPWSKDNPAESHLLNQQSNLSREEITANELRSKPVELTYSSLEDNQKDPLTGLLNRSMLHEILDGHITWSRKEALQSSFILAAIDNMGVINNAFGFDIGDEIIVGVGDHLAQHLRKGDIIGRYSTNKFGLILKSCGHVALPKAAMRFLNTISKTAISTSKGEIPVTISIGALLFPEYATDSAIAFSRVLEALDVAKSRSANNFYIYNSNPALLEQQQNNLIIADKIVKALQNKKVRLAMQPIVCSKTKQTLYNEALLVIFEDSGETIAAKDFIPIIEKLGLGRLIDYHVMELAIIYLRQNLEEKLAINISSLTTRDPEWLLKLRRKAGANIQILERLIVEVSETNVIGNGNEMALFVKRLKELGCKLAIDDFGTGFSSYVNLKKLGADYVKLDGALVENITSDQTDQIFVKSLIELAKSLRIKSVAKWVHSQEIADFMTTAGADHLQGFLYGKPKIIDIKREKKGPATAVASK